MNWIEENEWLREELKCCGGELDYIYGKHLQLKEELGSQKELTQQHMDAYCILRQEFFEYRKSAEAKIADRDIVPQKHIDAYCSLRQEFYRACTAKRQAENLVKKQKEEIDNLKSKLGYADRNRQWIDDATNWLGPAAAEAVTHLESARNVLGQISDAYHQVGVKYPWDKDEQSGT